MTYSESRIRDSERSKPRGRERAIFPLLYFIYQAKIITIVNNDIKKCVDFILEIIICLPLLKQLSRKAISKICCNIVPNKLFKTSSMHVFKGEKINAMFSNR